jgi:hypothetical protein
MSEDGTISLRGSFMTTALHAIVKESSLKQDDASKMSLFKNP